MNESESPPDLARQDLLSAMAHSLQKDKAGARADFQRARKQAVLFAPDTGLFRFLRASLYPEWRGDLQFSVSGLSGLSTNPAAVSSFGRETGAPASLFGGCRLSFQFEPMAFPRVRPLVMLGEKALAYAHPEASRYSYFMPEARIGLAFHAGPVAAVPSYHAGAYLLNEANRFPVQDTLWIEKTLVPGGTRWFYEYHRFEADLFLPGRFTLITGAGRRIFDRQVRTRTEGDAVLVLPPFGFHGASFTSACAVRYYAARQAAYDLYGNTALVSARYPLNTRLALGLSAVLSGDWYLHSADYFLENRTRKDLLGTLEAGIKVRFLQAFTGAFTYAFSYRYSNSGPDEYTDHRPGLEIRMDRNLFRETARREPAPHAIALPYTLKAGAGGPGLSAVRELLERREELQRSSSCLD
jgi:hypothetical protein